MMDGFNHQLVVIVPSCRAVITRLGATVDLVGIPNVSSPT